MCYRLPLNKPRDKASGKTIAPAGDRCRMKERKKASSLLQANVSGIPDRSPRKCHLSDVKIPAERHLADMKGTTLRSGVGEGRAGGV